jgi:hypothetical protein
VAIRIGRNLAVSELRRQRLEPVEAEVLEQIAAEAETVVPTAQRGASAIRRP